MLRTYAEVKEAISSGDTVVSILERYLTAINDNKNLNAFLEVFEDSAREQGCNRRSKKSKMEPLAN